MSTESPQTPLSPEELALRQKNVRKVVLLRGFMLGLIIGAWWIFFAPDSMVDAELRYVLGVLAGLIASGFYWFSLRQSLFPKKAL